MPTQNHNYNTPEQGTTDWNVPLNSNFEQIDADIEIRDTEANRSDYDPDEGLKYFETDTFKLFLGDGSDWNLVADLSVIGSLDSEGVEDIAGNLITGSGNVDVSYDDENGELSISGTDSQISDEDLYDKIASAIEYEDGIEFNFDDQQNKLIFGLDDSVNTGTGGTASHTEDLSTVSDGSSRIHVLSHEYGSVPGHIDLTPMTIQSSADPVWIGASETDVKIRHPYQGSTDNPVELKWSAQFTGDRQEFGFGPIIIDDFESTTPLSNDYTGDLDYFEKTTNTVYEGEYSLGTTNTLDPVAIYTIDTFDGRDRTYRVAIDGTNFSSFADFGIFASGTTYDDRSGYFVHADPDSGYLSFDLVDNGSETNLFEHPDAGVPQYDWFVVEVEPLVDGTISVRLFSSDLTLIDSETVNDSALDSGKISFAGNPNTNDAIYLNFDSAEIEEPDI